MHIPRPTAGLPAGARALRLAAATVAVLALATPALADAIDGEWCRQGRHFRIDGPEILTYAGTRLRGDYNRHGFRYVVPPNEPESGAVVEMVLRNDELVHLFKRPQDAPGHDDPPEEWRRCRVTS